jgi:phenylacetate-coenzyme A ligase PaaK-like adenylate-forming protein
MDTKPCGCGSNMPLVARVDGRDSDMFWIETEGVVRPLPPAVFELALSQVVDAREYQIVQESNNDFRILVEPLPGMTLDRGRADRILRGQLEEYGLSKRLSVELETVERLVPEKGNKFKRVVSKVPAPKHKSRRAVSTSGA